MNRAYLKPAAARVLGTPFWGRNDEPALVYDAWSMGELPDQEALQAVVADAWCGAEWPEDLLGTETWLELFLEAGYPAPRRSLTMYRGCVPGMERRMAWTTDRDKARWFAQRWVTLGAPEAVVYRATVKPGAVLAMIDEVCEDGGRQEHEIIVLPDFLGKLTIVERVGASVATVAA